jgi:hypothetical protein
VPGTTVTLVNIQTELFVLGADGVTYNVYNNLKPETATTTTTTANGMNYYSAAPYIQLPAGTYKLVVTINYTQTTNGVATAKSTSWTGGIKFQ